MNANTAFLRHEDDIVAKSKRFSIPGYDWEDIAQELRILLWRKLAMYEPGKASERTFADRLMTRRIIDLHRTANRKKRFMDSHHVSLDALMERENDLYDAFNDLNYE